MESQSPNTPLNLQSLVSVVEFATLRGIARGSVYNAIKDGRIKPVVIGMNNNHVFIDYDAYKDLQFSRWPNK